MIRSKTDTPADVISWMESEAASLWPAVLGSLSYRRTRCTQANCAACQSGEQHRSYVLYGRHEGRRFAIYVPEDLIDEVRRAVDNGRALQDLLMQAGPRYVEALKRARQSKPAPRSKKSKRKNG
ncbi:MAG: DUF6788 family protein [Candidatus Acidiferrales bacterium]